MSSRRQLNRRSLLKALALTGAVGVCPAAFTSVMAAQPRSVLPPWTEGCLDIHHIDTGRGNAALLIFPDGTTMLVDAGAVSSAPAGTINPARPNDSRRPGEWIARYVLQWAPAKQLDYFLATHLHSDHIDGLPDVVAQMPIDTCIDRAFPHYAANQQPPSAAKAYLEYLHERQSAGRKVEAAQVGASHQIVQRHSLAQGSSFQVRILAANGNVWNPLKHKAEAHLAHVPAPGNAHGYENNFSIALRVEYGPFSYYTGGDLDCDTFDGHMPELDIETPVAQACGRTEVAVANHHGYFDACGPAFTKALDAQAYIIPSWDIGHPGSAQMQRLLGAWDYNDGMATHDVFAMELVPQNALLNRRFAPKLKSRQGHVVVRVAAGVSTYRIYTLDSTVENGAITSISGPYTSRT